MYSYICCYISHVCTGYDQGFNNMQLNMYVHSYVFSCMKDTYHRSLWPAATT